VRRGLGGRWFHKLCASEHFHFLDPHSGRRDLLPAAQKYAEHGPSKTKRELTPECSSGEEEQTSNKEYSEKAGQAISRHRLAMAEFLYCVKEKCDQSRQRSVCRNGYATHTDSSLAGVIAFGTASCVSERIVMHPQVYGDAAEDIDARG
jgi:hypothetical protein